MNLTRIGILIAATVGLTSGQNAPAFEVASVKPHPMPAGQITIRFSGTSRPPVLQAIGNRFTENVATLQDLIMGAYGVKDYQIINMPDWAKAPRGEYFDIVAKSEGESTPTADQLKLMVQALLAERFKLKLHREMKELLVYALVIGKNGHKLRELSEAEKTAANDPAGPGERARVAGSSPPTTLKSTLPILIQLLSYRVDRPIVDQTGLTGMYEYSMVDRRQLVSEQEPGSLDPDAGRSIFSEVQDKMGLGLEPRKDLAEVLVIDHAEKPSPN